MTANRDELFAGVPVVFATSPSVEAELGLPKVREPRSTGVTSATDLTRTLTLVTQLQPNTKRVFVVSGSSVLDKLYEDVARTQFRALEGRFEFTYWSGLPMKDLLERVVDLPPDSILYPLMITQDGSGQRCCARSDRGASRLPRTCPSTRGACNKWVAARSAAA